MSEGSQSEEWRLRYLALWAERARIAYGMIADGETDPMRIIQMLEHLGRHFTLGFNTAGTVWIRNKSDPKTLLPSGIPAFRKASFNGQSIQVSAYTYANIPYFLADFFREQGPFDAVVELGCGFGQNLFRLNAAGLPRSLRYFGGELTESGVTLGRDLARLDPRIRVQFFPFDHLAPDLSAVTGVENPLVFTCHSLEQVTEVPQAFFAAVAGLAPRVTCVHLEPFGFQIRSVSLAAQEHRRHFEKEGWNLNLHAAAEAAEQAGIIKRTVLIPDIFLSTDGVNVTSLMVWTKPGATRAG